MKRQNSIHCKEGSEAPQKKRSKSLDNLKVATKRIEQTESIKKSFSNIRKLLSLDLENDKFINKERIHPSSFPDFEFFSDINLT